MTRTLLAVVLASIVMFIWGAVFWISPVPYAAVSHTNDDAAAGQALLQHFPETGAYFIPGLQNDEQSLTRLHEAGPLATIYIQRDGRPPAAGDIFLYGFVHELIAVGLMALLLTLALPTLGSFVKRWGFVVVAGMIGSVFTNVANMIWWYHPAGLHLYNMLYELIAWGLAGAVLAAMIRPRPARTG